MVRRVVVVKMKNGWMALAPQREPRDVFFEMSGMVQDINPREIAQHYADGDMNRWTNAWGDQMEKLIQDAIDASGRHYPRRTIEKVMSIPVSLQSTADGIINQLFSDRMSYEAGICAGFYSRLLNESGVEKMFQEIQEVLDE